MLREASVVKNFLFPQRARRLDSSRVGCVVSSGKLKEGMARVGYKTSSSSFSPHAARFDRLLKRASVDNRLEV